MACVRIIEYDGRYILNVASLEVGGMAAEINGKRLDIRVRDRQTWLVWSYLGPFFGPEGGPYGHQRVVWSTRIPTRKVNMI